MSFNRLQKIISESIILSIRKADILIKQGRVTLNGRRAILLTNNGDLTLRLTHTKYCHSKTYLFWVSGQPRQSKLDNWRKGILLDGKMTMPARIEVLEEVNGKSLLKVILNEGRNRQIRIIANLIVNLVQDLKRISISNINLNGLLEGKWRELKTEKWISNIN